MKWSNVSNFLSLLSVLVTFSTFFYYAGLLNEYGTDLALGIPLHLTQYPYEETFVVGILQYLPIIFILLISIEKIYTLYIYNKGETEISKTIQELIPHRNKITDAIERRKKQEDKGDDLDKEFNQQLQEANELYKRADYALKNSREGRKEILENWQKQVWWLLGGNILINLIFQFFFFKLNLTSLNQALVNFLIAAAVTAITYYCYAMLGAILAEKIAHLRLGLLVLPIMLLLIFLYPAASGFFTAKVDADTSLSKVTIYEGSESFTASYVYSDEDNYILKINGQIVIIPTSEVSKAVFQ